MGAHAGMSRTFIITGTDTGIGKTVVAAGLAGLLGATYWKPVQSGLEGETDSEVVARPADCPRSGFCRKPGAYRNRSRHIAPPSLTESR